MTSRLRLAWGAFALGALFLVVAVRGQGFRGNGSPGRAAPVTASRVGVLGDGRPRSPAPGAGVEREGAQTPPASVAAERVPVEQLGVHDTYDGCADGSSGALVETRAEVALTLADVSVDDDRRRSCLARLAELDRALSARTVSRTACGLFRAFGFVEARYVLRCPDASEVALWSLVGARRAAEVCGDGSIRSVLYAGPHPDDARTFLLIASPDAGDPAWTTVHGC